MSTEATRRLSNEARLNSPRDDRRFVYDLIALNPMALSDVLITRAVATEWGLEIDASLPGTLRRARVDLLDAGLIRDSGHTVRNPSGMPAVTWVTTGIPYPDPFPTARKKAKAPDRWYKALDGLVMSTTDAELLIEWVKTLLDNGKFPKTAQDVLDPPPLDWPEFEEFDKYGFKPEDDGT